MAGRLFKAAARLEPHNFEPLVYLARIAAIQEQNQLALEYLKRAALLGFNNWTILEQEKIFATIIGLKEYLILKQQHPGQ